MVRVARRLTTHMARDYMLRAKAYGIEIMLQSEKPRKESVESLDNPIKDEAIHKGYRAALRKMKVHADRDGISLLVRPKITYLNTDTILKQNGTRGVLTLRIEARAYVPRN